MTAKIYWMDGCGPCAGVKRWLTGKGIDFTDHKIETMEDFQNTIGAMGYTQVPVVETSNGIWAYRDGLPKLKEMLDN